MMLLFESPWPWLAGSVLCVAVGVVAASGWSPCRRRRTRGVTMSFERKRLG